MKIDLAAQARASGYRGKTIELREIVPTKAQASDLARIYMPVVRIWADGCRDQLMPEYRRSLSDIQMDDAFDLDAIIETINARAVQAIISFRNSFSSWANRVNLWHIRKIVDSLRYSTNVDLNTQMHAGDVRETIDDVLVRNVALIRNISDQARGRISDIVFRGLQSRTPAREVAKEIARATGMARDRALRIASDQTAKLSAALDRERQDQLGMSEFEWIHSGKLHYRPEHKARDGKVFSWSSDVGRNDPPGQKPFCGCKARGLLRLE